MNFDQTAVVCCRDGSGAQQAGSVDVRFDASGGGLAAECGISVVGIVAVVDQDPNGTVDR
jgi:hypothetical protein